MYQCNFSAGGIGSDEETCQAGESPADQQRFWGTDPGSVKQPV